jgi:hypothetical protein
MNELVFYSFPVINDEARKITRRKIGSSFHELIKLDLEDLVGPATHARNAL